MRCSGTVWAVHRGRVVPGIRRPRRQALALDPAALVVRVRRVAVASVARAPAVSAVVAVPAVSVRVAVPAVAVA